MTTLAPPQAELASAAERAGAGLRMLGNEIAKALQVMWAHKTPLVLELFMASATYWALMLFIGGGRFVTELLGMTLAGYLAYVVSYFALLRIVSGVLEEMFTGTLEQSLLSPLRPWVQSVGRLIGSMIESVAVAAAVGAAFLGAFAGLGVELTFQWSVLVPILVTLADVAGFAMLLGGLALVVNSIGAIVHVIQGFLMFLNGALIPIFAFPGWLELVAKLVPTTLGVDAIRRLTAPVDGTVESLGDVWADGTLPWALVHAAILLVLGWAIYQAAIRRGLRDGRLGA
ncbi:MAG TPA: ABC transporter permease [Jiangellaceae bacterium]